MYWIESIGRDTQGFVLETVAPQKGRSSLSLKHLAEPLELGHASRTRLTTDCATWSRKGGAVVWELLGLSKHSPNDGQAIFCFTDDGRNYLVPASVLIAAMMRPIQRIHTFLFKAQGLESFSTPLVESEMPTVGFTLSPATIFGAQNQTPKGLLATYSWMHCFPSANAMWSSVYLAACQGQLDVELPKARLTMTLRSVPAGKYRLVTEILITKLEALESPYPFAANHATNIIMHESSELDWKTLHQAKSTLLPRADQAWQLSDAEWESIEPLFAGREQTKFRLRDILDLILVKLGTGQAWRKLNFGELNFSIVQATYQRMNKRGQWPAIVEILTTMRKPVS